MNRFINTSSDNIILVLIFVVILALFKAIVSIGEKVNDKANLIDKEVYAVVDESLDTILDTIVLIFAFYILFYRKDNSIVIIIIGIIFLLRGFLQYFIDLKLYKYTNIDNSTIDKITKFKTINSVISDTCLAVITIYVITQIFK
jgi:hypothetical protein